MSDHQEFADNLDAIMRDIEMGIFTGQASNAPREESVITADDLLLLTVPLTMRAQWDRETCLKWATAVKGREVCGFTAYESPRCENGEMFFVKENTIYHLRIPPLEFPKVEFKWPLL